MTAPTPDALLTELLAEVEAIWITHVPSDERGDGWCGDCGRMYPCEAARLAEIALAALATVGEYEQAHIVGCRCAEGASSPCMGYRHDALAALTALARRTG